MKKYSDKTDNEIICLIRSGDNSASDYLLSKYSDLVKKETRYIYIMGGDNEDAIQEGMIGLFNAIRDYDTEKNDNFYSFAKLCIERQLYNAVTASNRKKHGPLNYYLSYYNTDSKQNVDDNTSIIDTLEASKENNPEEVVIDRERLSYINRKIEECLSALEKKVLSYYIDGMSYQDIAKKLSKPPKSIDNAIQRIRNKLAEIK